MSRFLRTFASVWAAALAAASPLTGQQVVDLPARDQALRPTFTDVFRVGKIEGASWELYGRRVEAAFDGTGNLHIFDPENFRVVVVSPTGSFLREIGTRGEGPGELRNPSGFAVMRDGTVVIADIGQRAFLLYNTAGEYQRSVAFASANATTTATSSVVALGAILADPRGGSVISAGRRVVMMTAEAGRGGAPTPPSMPTGRPIIRYTLAGEGGSRQVHSAWEAPPLPPATMTSGGGGRAVMAFAAAQRAFEPQLFTTMLPDGGLALSDSSAYAIKLVGPDGGIRSVLRRGIRPRAVNGRIQEAEKERRLEQLASGGGPQIRIQTDGPGGGGGGGRAMPSQADVNEMMRRSVDQLQFFPEVPVITGVVAGWTGKIWVERRGEDIYEDGPVDVLTSTGQYLGTIAPGGPDIPSAFGPNGLAAFVETDALDVVTVAVRRLPTELR